MTTHQQKQLGVIEQIEKQVKANTLNFSTVSPVADYENDPRISLTSVHLPDNNLISQIFKNIVDPIRKIAPDLYYYSNRALHMTIKNVRTINNPPQFTESEAKKVTEIFSQIIPKHKRFKVYFYRLMLFRNNLALIGTTDPELDNIILDLDLSLNAAGIPDNKKYINSKYFFSNITLVRFNTKLGKNVHDKINELSQSIKFTPYTVDTVTLLTCNAVFNNQKIRGKWSLL